MGILYIMVININNQRNSKSNIKRRIMRINKWKINNIKIKIIKDNNCKEKYKMNINNKI